MNKPNIPYTSFRPMPPVAINKNMYFGRGDEFQTEISYK